jgi:hypothetical protein
MTITFKYDNDVIVYALEKIISYARRTQQIFVAQCVWWLASIIGLEQGLINYIDSVQSRIEVTINPEKVQLREEDTSPQPRDIQEDKRRDQVLKECAEFLKDRKRLRNIAKLKTSGKTRTGRINPSEASKKSLRAPKRKATRDFPKTKGINLTEIERRKSAGECLRCAWPADSKGAHRVKDCVRLIQLDKGTARYPKDKEYQKTKQVLQQSSSQEKSSESTSSDESSDDSL